MDIMLMKGGQRMHGVMKKMWENFGKNGLGYDLKDFEQAVISLATDKEEMQQFFTAYVWEKGDLFSLLQELLTQIGLKLEKHKPNDPFKGDFGILNDTKGNLIKIHPKSPAYEKLMIKDKIMSYALATDGIHLQVSRWGETLAVSLPKTGSLYFADYKITLSGNSSDFARFIDL
jgi:predicted metalloprotease with PDZ domain